MRKLLIGWVCGASLGLLGGCAWLDKIPFVYKQDIQQGNVVDQELIDQLRPGMTKTQVRFVMGTPMLTDVFHQDRWDYVYTMKEGGGDMAMRRVSVYFDDNQLVRIEGDLRPSADAPELPVTKETVVDVPDGAYEEKGFVSRAMQSIGLGGD